MLYLKVNVALFCLIAIATQTIVADPVTFPTTKSTKKPTIDPYKEAEPVTVPKTKTTTKATTKATKATEPVTTPRQTTRTLVVDRVNTDPLETTPAPKTTTEETETTEAESETEHTTTGETDATTLYEWEETDGCLYKDRLWPSIDGTKFYFCLPGTNTPVEQSCNRLTFFQMTKEMSGCIPFSEITSNCIDHDVVGSCTGNNLLQPQTDINPTYFYICLGENQAPLKLQCEEGKAFLHQDGYLGCFEWKQWREIRGCPMFG